MTKEEFIYDYFINHENQIIQNIINTSIFFKNKRCINFKNYKYTKFEFCNYSVSLNFGKYRNGEQRNISISTQQFIDGSGKFIQNIIRKEKLLKINSL